MIFLTGWKVLKLRRGNIFFGFCVSRVNRINTSISESRKIHENPWERTCCSCAHKCGQHQPAGSELPLHPHYSNFMLSCWDPDLAESRGQEPAWGWKCLKCGTDALASREALRCTFNFMHRGDVIVIKCWLCFKWKACNPVSVSFSTTQLL